jgi:hypothetical protein
MAAFTVVLVAVREPTVLVDSLFVQLLDRILTASATIEEGCRV